MSQVSVIIPVYRDHASLRDCLRALAACDGIGAAEALVVDNSDGDEAVAAACSEFPFARYLTEPTPGSYSARNVGAARASGDIFAFIDADCRADSDYLRALTARVASAPSVIHAGRVEVVIGSDDTAYAHLDRMFGLNQQKMVAAGAVVTANVFLHRSVFAAVGPFDGRLRSGGDIEWSRRAGRAGHRIEYAPDVVVRHPARATFRDHDKKNARVQAGQIERARLHGDAHPLSSALAMMLKPPLTRIFTVARAADLSVTQRASCILALARLWLSSVVRTPLLVMSATSRGRLR